LNSKYKDSEETKKKKSKSRLKMLYEFGRKRFFYKDQGFRSSWEVKYAEHLDQNGIKWEFEPRRFKLSNEKVYSPDFYLPETDEFIEIKGYWLAPAKEKFDLFKKDYPEIDIRVLMQEELIGLGVLP